MRIVPEDSGLEIEAYVLNHDIGFVAVGQEAVVKIESFPFTRYGPFRAHVTRVARDAIPEPDADGSRATGARLKRPVSPAASARRTSFPGPAEPGRRHDLRRRRHRAADVRHGGHGRAQDWRRRILEYLFSPLVEVASKAMRER